MSLARVWDELMDISPPQQIAPELTLHQLLACHAYLHLLHGACFAGMSLAR